MSENRNKKPATATGVAGFEHLDRGLLATVQTRTLNRSGKKRVLQWCINRTPTISPSCGMNVSFVDSGLDCLPDEITVGVDDDAQRGEIVQQSTTHPNQAVVPCDSSRRGRSPSCTSESLAKANLSEVK